MDFHKENGVHTSDKHDYYSNPWDKGHLAPAATYSDSYNNLYTTFSYLNCTLQQQDLNRGAWRLLEQEERVWDDEQNLTITIENIFEEGHEVLPTGGHIPTTMVKTIYFDDDGTCRKFVFPNEKPTKPWNEYEVECEVETQGKARKKSLL
jgi:endonuclease G